MAMRRAERMEKLFEGRRALGVVATTCIVFFTLGVLVRYSALQAFDLRASERVQRDQWPPLQTIMKGFTYAGSPGVVPVVGVLAALALWRGGLPRAAKLVAFSLVSIPLFILLKLFWDRARPDAPLVRVAVRTAGTSFPSGHATGGTALYGALAALAWIHLDHRPLRLPVTLGLALLPLAIDASRVYLGAHWTSDVVGGSAVGLLILVPLLRWYLGGVRGDDEGASSPVPEP